MSTVDPSGEDQDLFDADPTPVLNPTITRTALALAARPDEHAIIIQISHVAIGTGQYDPVGDEIALQNEVGRFAISSGGNSPAPGQLQIGTTIRDKDDSGRPTEGLAIGELGFFDGPSLIAVWSRATGGPLFIKAKGFDVPFAYTLDVSVLPAGSVTIVVSPDPDGMAAMVLRHEARANPHPQYALLTGADFTGPVAVHPRMAGVYALSAYRYNVPAQSLKLGAAPNPDPSVNRFDNWVQSLSDPATAKWLILNATTDEKDSPTTGASVGIGLHILGQRKAHIAQSGRFFVGSPTDNGVSLLQVNGSAAVRDNITFANARGGVGTAGMFVGNGDGASATTANFALRSWFGIGFGPSINTMPVPATEYSHWFDTRTGNTGMRGTLTVGGIASAQTPPANDTSTRLATTEWVVAKIGAQAIGTIILEIRTNVRAGCLKLNGVLLKRTDYPALWAYAQASGALVSETEWLNGRYGCFSIGDGATTFRIPEFRGEFPRFWDDGRGVDGGRTIGSFQNFGNAWHAHGASTDVQGDHTHGAWTDAQGDHGHYVNDPGHQHSFVVIAHSTDGGGTGQLTGGGFQSPNDGQYNGVTDPSGVGIWLNNAGQHGHNVGIGVAGAHGHNVSIAGDGGNEARPRSIALLAMIHAF